MRQDKNNGTELHVKAITSLLGLCMLTYYLATHFSNFDGAVICVFLVNVTVAAIATFKAGVALVLNWITASAFLTKEFREALRKRRSILGEHNDKQ